LFGPPRSLFRCVIIIVGLGAVLSGRFLSFVGVTWVFVPSVIRYVLDNYFLGRGLNVRFIYDRPLFEVAFTLEWEREISPFFNYDFTDSAYSHALGGGALEVT
jgi:hypothetical protein